MKRFFVFAAFAAALSFGLASCADIEPDTKDANEEIKENNQEGNLTINFECMMDDATRTEYHDKTIWWSKGDVARFAQYASVGGVMKTVFVSNGALASSKNVLSVSVSQFNTPDENTDSYYMAVFPNSSFVSYDPSSGNVRMKMKTPAAQTPSLTSFDSNADLLISEYKKNLEKNDEGKYSVQLRFKRMIALPKMTITNLPSSEKIKSVQFSAKQSGQDVLLAGEKWYDFVSGSTTSNVSAESKYSIALDYSDVEGAASGMTAYFCCYPFELVAGDSFKVVVTTESGEIFTREVTLSGSQTLSLKEGRGTKFSVDMAPDICASVVIDGEEEYYNTLEEAVSAADGNTATITLWRDCTLASDINPASASSDITLDLNGKTITESNDARIKLQKGKFTINDTVGSGEILMPNNGDGANTIWIYGTADVVINSCTIINNTANYGIAVQGGNLTVNDGTVTSGLNCIYVNSSSATVTINGGSFKNEYSGTTQATGFVVRNSSGAVTINNGYFYTCCTASTPLCFGPSISSPTTTYYASIKEAYLNTSLLTSWGDSGSTLYGGTYNHTHNGEALVYTKHIKPTE